MMNELRQGTGDARVVIDATGEPWRVYELSGALYDRRDSLVFESSTAVRRVRNYPRDWRLLSDRELLALQARL
jgi:hypothetical protein